MTREDIIRMAWDAGIVRFEGGEMEAYGIGKPDQFDHTQAFWSFASPENLSRFAALVAAAEREACAKVCDERERANLYGVKECAAAIRARGNK